MADETSELLKIARRVQELLELLAEDKLAERDAKQRAELRSIVGASVPKQKSVMIMDGTRTQAEISRATSLNAAHLSRMVGELQKAKLLSSDHKNPALVISLPASFFGA